MIDRFGTKNAQYTRADASHFNLTAEVEVSEQFFSWVCGFGKRVKIVNADVAEQYKAFLNKISDHVLKRGRGFAPLPLGLQLVQIVLQNIDATLGDGEIVALRDMNVTMSHLITEKMNGSVHFCEHRSEGVPKIMILKLDAELGFNLASGVLHRVHCLNRSIHQAVHKFKRRNFTAVQVIDEALFLLSLCLGHAVDDLHLMRSLRQMLAQNIGHVDDTLRVPSLRRDELDDAILICHLSVNRDGTILQVYIRPFEAEAFIDTKTTIPPEEISSLRIFPLEIFIQERKLFMREGDDVRIILCLHLRHSDARVLVHAGADCRH